MKIYASICALVLLFHLAVCTQDSSSKVGTFAPNCCFSHVPKKIPLSRVARYYATSETCSLPSIVFITTRGRQVCADPRDEWVLEYVSRLEEN